MKKILPALFTLLSALAPLHSQESNNPGKPVLELFTNFHCSMNNDTTTGFGLERAFVGYNYRFDQNLSALVLLNIGKPDDLPPGAEPRRYSYVREASFAYSLNRMNIIVGITTTRLFGTQQKFWGKRYLAEPIETLHDYGYNADLGIVADFKPNDKLSLDISVTNGEGYSNIQLDNNVKTSVGLTFNPGEQMTFRLYGDFLIPGEMFHSTLLCFAGFKNDLFTVGAEAIYQTRHENINDHDLWGFSGTGSVNVCRNTELFVRYDHSASVKVRGGITQWTYDDDDDFLIGGIQYIFNKNLRMALNYQGTFPDGSGETRKELIFLSSRFYF